MNKTELVAAIAAKTNLTKKDAEAAVQAFVDVVTDELKNDGKVAIMGFGTFEVSERAARTGIDPRTKEQIEIAACKSPKFKAGKTFKDAVK
ncbi:MAG: HU family DNA-binding protein [Lachnospiraceae bacterium]|nr:HU family DNA-binding protein [Lachnospiraceae bacterium]